MAQNWQDRDRSRYGSGSGGYGGEGYRGERDRDWTDRAADEMRSWMGSEDNHRRFSDDRRGGFGGPSYGGDERSFGRDYRQEDWDRSMSGPSRSLGYGGYESGYQRGGRAGGSYGREDYGRSSGQGYDRFSAPGGTASESYGYPVNRYADRDYRGSDDRGFLERAGDAMSSWFGGEESGRHGQHRGRGPKGYTRSDDRIREDVSDRLSDDPHIDASDIEVTVSKCEVTLSGTVDDRFAKRHAEDLAERISGVTHVQNNIRVKASSGLGMSTDQGNSTSTSGTNTGVTSIASGSTGARRRSS